MKLLIRENKPVMVRFPDTMKRETVFWKVYITIL